MVKRRTTTDHPGLAAWARGQEAHASAPAAFDHQLAKFREKFGREPGPHDPIFFDPEAAQPQPLTPEQVDAGFEEVIAAVIAAGLDPAFIQAWREVGYLVGTENRHLFSGDEVRAFEAAVVRHRGGPRAQTGGESDDVATPGDDEAALEGLVLALADGFEKVVAGTLRTPGPGPALHVVQSLREGVDEDTGELISASTFAVLTGWLTGAREHGVPSAPAVAWVSQHLGEQGAAPVLTISGLLGHEGAPKISMQEAADRLGGSLVPALLWLACGVAATAGANDAHWLRQFDLADL